MDQEQENGSGKHIPSPTSPIILLFRSELGGRVIWWNTKEWTDLCTESPIWVSSKFVTGQPFALSESDREKCFIKYRVNSYRDLTSNVPWEFWILRFEAVLSRLWDLENSLSHRTQWSGPEELFVTLQLIPELIPRIVLFTVKPNMNLNWLIKPSCDRITNIQCSVGTIVAAFGKRFQLSERSQPKREDSGDEVERQASLFINWVGSVYNLPSIFSSWWGCTVRLSKSWL